MLSGIGEDPRSMYPMTSSAHNVQLHARSHPHSLVVRVSARGQQDLDITFHSFYKKVHIGFLQLLKWPHRTSFVTHVEPLN